MSLATRQETTYADLRSTDLIIDKTGKAWPIVELVTVRLEGNPITRVRFWLCDPVTKIKMHFVDKVIGEPVTVLRKESHADELAKLDAEVEQAAGGLAAAANVSPEEAKVNLAQAMGDVEVEAEVTAEQEDAARDAKETGVPIELPDFETLTDLERRSHLYVMHGVYALDVQPRAKLAEMHAKAHADHDAGKLKSKHVPHTHEGAK